MAVLLGIIATAYIYWQSYQNEREKWATEERIREKYGPDVIID